MEGGSMTGLEFDGVTKKNKRLFRLSILGLIIGLLMIAAGGTMLGIGIHKNNKKSADCTLTTLTSMIPTSSVSSSSSTTTPHLSQNVFILLDASQDIAGGDFQTMKDYVATAVVPYLPINTGGSFNAATSTNVAVLSYAEDSVTIHDFYDVKDIATLQNQIANIPQSLASSGVTKAVSLTNQLLPMGNQPNLMMVMGSGNQQDLQNAVKNIQQLKLAATNVAWIALGKANKLDFSQIINATTFYGSNNYELSNDDTKKLLGQLNPNNLTPPPPTIPTVNRPTCNNDVIILIDESIATKSSVVFNAELSFLTNILVNSWTVNMQSTEALAISYSLESATALSDYPFAYNSVDLLKTDINKKKGNIPIYRSSITAGLNYAQSHLSGRRSNTNLTTLLITYSSSMDDIVSAIPESIAIGGQLVILAVGDQIITDNLYYLSGTILRTSPLFEGDIANQINQAICAMSIPTSPLPQTTPTFVPVSVTTPTMQTITVTIPSTGNPSTLPSTLLSTVSSTLSSTLPSTLLSTVSSTLPSTLLSTVSSTLSSTLSSTPLPTTTINPSSYQPCLSDIVFAQDMSNSYSGTFRNATLTLTSKFIVTSFWNHFERFGLVGYAANQSTIFNFGNFSTRDDFTKAVQALQAYSVPTSITSGLNAIDAGFITPKFVQNTIFYISKADPADVQSAIPVANRIGLKGKLILVAVGSGATIEALQPLASDNTLIIAFDPASTLGYDTTAKKIRDSLICDPSSYSSTTSTIAPTTPFTGTTQTIIYTVASTTTPSQYLPCQSSISFTSYVYLRLSAADFGTQQKFISNAIGIMNHPERIQYLEGNSDVVNWNNDLSIKDIQNQIADSTQRNETFSMRQVLAGLWGMFDLNMPKPPVGTLVFVSTTLDAASYAGGQQFADDLKNANVKLTFVLMGQDMDESLLTNYTTNFIHWRNLSNSQPDDWNDNFMSAYNCPTLTSPASLATSPTTVATSPAATVPSTFPTTVLSTTVLTTVPTTPQPTTTTTGAVPYVPCKSWISFSSDGSNVLSLANYKTQLAFISSAIGKLNHPERLQYGDERDTYTPWGSNDSISGIQTNVNTSSQISSLRFSLRKVLGVVYSAYTTAVSGVLVQSPISAIIFVSDTSSPENYEGAKQFSDPLKAAGVKLTFVLLGPNPDQTLLTPYATNFVTWRNLDNSQPDDWNDSTVYNCLLTF